jgi:peptidyl-tRNA hydrolase, PTH1 family
MKLIVGLGNPGKEYEKTRHNAGFLVLDEIARRLSVEFSPKSALKGDVAEAKESKIVLLKPDTFMNRSGEAVKAVATKYRVQPADILVILDDADLGFGDIRFREGGSAAGHNGMKSILEHFPSADIKRVKVGIGRDPNGKMELDAWVLGKWTREEAAELPEMIETAAAKARDWYGD